MGQKDIKNFTKFPSLSDDDLLLGTKTSLGGTDAAITVANFKKQVAQDVEPTINENGYWVVNGVNTGKKAEGATPVLEGGSTTTGEPGSQSSSSIVRSGETPEGLPRYIISLTIPRGTTGNDGKTPQLKIGTVENGDDASASLSFDGEDMLGNPVYKINLVLPKGETGDPGIDGKTPKFEAGIVTTLAPGDQATAQITFKQNDVDGSPIYTISLSIPKGDTGDSGKTPILESVNVTSGEIPSGSFTKNGVDEDGNPKYILNLTTPKGKDGQPAVFEQGATTTLDPSEEARVEVVENGETPEGNPKYILNFFIPRGKTGPAGAGTGNVLVDAAGLVSGKKYLFVPDSDNSSSGTFMEYIEPVIPTKTSDLTNNSGFITKAVNDLTNYYLKSETYTKEEVQSLISAINSVTLQKVDSLPEPGESNVIYLVPKSGSGNDIYDEYIYIDGKPEHIGSTQVDLSNYVQEAPSDGKTYGRKNEGWVEIVGEGSVIIPNSVVLLFIQNKDNIQAIPSDQILTAFGGEDSFNSIVDGIIADRPVFVQYEVTTGVSIFFPVLSMYGMNDGINSILAVSVNIDLSIIEDSAVCRLNITVGKQEGEYLAEGSVVFVETKAAYLDLSKALDADGNFLNTIPQSFYDEIQEAFNNKTTSGLTKDDRIVPINIVKNSDDYTVSGVTEIAYGGVSILTEIITLSVSSDLTLYGYKGQSVFMTNGDGTEALMDDGTYKKVFDPKSVTTATTLTNLSIENYSIKVTLSAASALSFASTPAEGWECMIDIKNTGSSDITQALPNATGWQCDEDSITIAAGKIASISVRYVHGVYVVLSRGN